MPNVISLKKEPEPDSSHNLSSINSLYPYREFFPCKEREERKKILHLLLIHQLVSLMKKTALLSWFLLSVLLLHAQLPEGTYREGNDSLHLKDQYAIFRISGFTGLSVAQVGEGKYEQLDEILIIHTTPYSGSKSSSQAVPASHKDSCVVEVVGSNNYPLPTILVESHSRSGKLLEGKVTDQQGKVIFTETEKIGSIVVTAMGYDDLTLQYEPEKDYRVQLVGHEVIENKDVVFRCRMTDEETLSLLMLSDDFDPGRNRDRALQKLLKKAQQSNRIDKRLKKVYVPYERKF